MSIIYYKLKQSITSTHTNYFDRIFKERGAKLRLSWTIIPIQINLSTPCRLYFSSRFLSRMPRNPEEADHYNLLSQLVNIHANFIFLPNILSALSKQPAPKELRIIQPSFSSSSCYFCTARNLNAYQFIKTAEKLGKGLLFCRHLL